LPMLKVDLGNECPEFTGQPDVTVKEGTQTRFIYIAQGIVTDKTNCLNVTGEGLLYFPIHRDFLIGPKTDTLSLSTDLKVSRDKDKLLGLRKTAAGWESLNLNPDQMLNWDFVNHFIDSLARFDVRFRAV